MLTKHNYKPSTVNIGKDSDLFKCCKKESPEDPKCTDCCYDTWRDELKIVTRRYSEKLEQAQQLQKKLGIVAERRNKFKTWLDELEKAEDLARKICNQLDVIAGQSDKIWYNACNAVQAIEILFCMIRDFYSQVDYLKARYDDLQNCINKNSNPALVKDQGVLKCLKEYYDKLDAIIKTRDELIKAILEAVKLSNLLRNNISTKDCPEVNCGCGDNNNAYDPCADHGSPCDCHCDESADSYYGFKTIICEWFCSFECDDDCKPGEDPCKEEKPKQNYGHTPSPVKECKPCKDEHCDLEPELGFPLCKDDYKCCIKKRYEFDNNYAKELEVELNEANKEKENLLACKTSLDKAIAEVDPKTRCQ